MCHSFTTPEDSARALSARYEARNRIAPRSESARWIAEHPEAYRELLRDCQFAQRRGETVGLGTFISAIRRAGVVREVVPRRDQESAYKLAQGVRAIMGFENPQLRKTIGS